MVPLARANSRAQAVCRKSWHLFNNPAIALFQRQHTVASAVSGNAIRTDSALSVGIGPVLRRRPETARTGRSAQLHVRGEGDAAEIVQRRVADRGLENLDVPSTLNITSNAFGRITET